MPKSGKRTTGIWLILPLLIGAGGVAAWYLNNARAHGPQYLTAAVIRGDLTQVVTATGQLNPVINVQVGSQISGIIQKLLVDIVSVSALHGAPAAKSKANLLSSNKP